MASIPSRIINRYLNNFKFLATQVRALIDELSGKAADTDLVSIAENLKDPFGLKKTLVLLTKPNKVIAISSFDGKTQWSFQCP